MPILQAKDEQPGLRLVEAPFKGSLEDELDFMVGRLRDLISIGDPAEILMVCMSYMARCTELSLQLVRVEHENRKARYFRTSQLSRVMDLIDFEYRGASRMVELRRQELDTTH